MRSLRTVRSRRCLLTGRLIAFLVGHRARVCSVSRCHAITGARHARWCWERRLRPRHRPAPGRCSPTESMIATGTPAATATGREGSGCYVVPLARQAALERLRALIAKTPIVNGGQLVVLMLGQIAATRRQLAQAAFKDVMAQLGGARQDLAAFAAGPNRTVRAATVANRLTGYRDLTQRVQRSADLLGMQHEQIQHGLDELTDQARTLVAQVAAGGADPAGAATRLPLPGLVAAG